MSCECYQIGGPWITYDPSCPAHGDDAQREEKLRERAEEEREERHQAELEAAKIKWIKVKDVPPKPGMIVKKFKNGAVWAGRYSGAEKESSFVEYIQLPE